MRPLTLSKLLLGLGPLYPVLLIVGFAAFPAPAQSDHSAAIDPAFLAAHSGAVIAQAYVRSFGALAFLALALGVAAVLRRTVLDDERAFGPALVTVGGAGAAVPMLLAQATVLAAAFAQRDHVTAEALRLCDSLNEAALAVSSLPAVFLFGGAAYGLDADPRRWLRAFCWAGVPLSLLDAVGYDGGPLGAVSGLGLVYFLLWGLTAPLALLRRSADDGTSLPTSPSPATP